MKPAPIVSAAATKDVARQANRTGERRVWRLKSAGQIADERNADLHKAKLTHGRQNIRGDLLHDLAGRPALRDEIEGNMMDAGFTHRRQGGDQPSPAAPGAEIKLLIGCLGIIEQLQNHGLAETAEIGRNFCLGIMPKRQSILLDG